MHKSKQKINDNGLRLAVELAGGSRYKLAKLLKMNLSGLMRWKRIPLARIIQIEQLLGVDRAKLRPDLFKR